MLACGPRPPATNRGGLGSCHDRGQDPLGRVSTGVACVPCGMPLQRFLDPVPPQVALEFLHAGGSRDEPPESERPCCARFRGKNCSGHETNPPRLRDRTAETVGSLAVGGYDVFGRIWMLGG